MKSRRIIPIFTVTHFSHHLCTEVMVPLLPLLRQDLGLNYFQTGVLVSSFSLSYGFGQIPMALLADRFSRRSLIALGLIGTSLSAMAVGLTRTYWQMVPCFIALGLLGATYHAPASSFLSQSVPPDQRGRSLGTHLIGGSASFLLTPPMAVYIATWARTWRLSFFLLAAPALAMSALLGFTTRQPHEAGRTAEKVQVAPPMGGSNPNGGPVCAPNPTITWGQIIHAIGILTMISILMQMVFSSVYSYLPLYLVDRHGITPEYAGIMVGLVAGAGIVGGPLGGALSDRLGRKQVILLSLSLAGPLLFAATRAPAGIWMPLALAAYGTSISARMPAMESFIADVVPPRRRATVLGIYYLLGQETSGVVTPLVGYLIDLRGLDPVFTGLALGLCLVSMITLTFRKRI
jgi:FSR family fosmidomycin resistance protein-like MFS transporter